MSDTGNGGRERAYRALAESEELYRATLSSISDAVFLTDDEGLFTFICPNVDVIFGYVPDEVQAMGQIGKLLGEQLFDPAELAARGEIANIEREIASKSGRRRCLLIHIKRVAIRHSTMLYTCRDVTELKRAEDELRAARLDLAHAARLALVGQLVASISHEINQPLTAIQTNASAGLRLVSHDLGSDELSEVRDILTDIHDQSRRADDIMARLRTLAGRRPMMRQALDVNEVAGDMVRLVGTEARRRGVTLRTELGPSLPRVAADRVCLQQVMLNLIVNAMDAMDELAMEDRRVVVRTRQLDGGVEVEVSDVGHGIPAEYLPKLFDAFFTTKKDGLGLGLAIVRSIVEAHQGRIWAEDHGGRGVTFHVTLPVMGAMAS